MNERTPSGEKSVWNDVRKNGSVTSRPVTSADLRSQVPAAIRAAQLGSPVGVSHSHSDLTGGCEVDRSARRAEKASGHVSGSQFGWRYFAG